MALAGFFYSWSEEQGTAGQNNMDSIAHKVISKMEPEITHSHGRVSAVSQVSIIYARPL